MPIAGVSHWRREPEFNAAQAAKGLDLIDDRLFWSPLPWASPEKRSLLWSRAGGKPGQLMRRSNAGRTGPTFLGSGAITRKGHGPFRTRRPTMLLGAYSGLAGDWDGLVRRGIFVFPTTWGEGPVGTVGGEDIFQIAEVVNGSPHIYGLWPHAASIFLRGYQIKTESDHRLGDGLGRPAGKAKYRSVSRWDHDRGRLLIDTPYTQGVAGWLERRTGVVAAPRFRDPELVRGLDRDVDQQTSRSPPPRGCSSPPSPESNRPDFAGSIP